MKVSKRQNAFTLVELLIATAIIALIMTAVAGAYFVTSRSVVNCQAKLEFSRQGRSLLEKMARQIRSACVNQNQNNDELKNTWINYVNNTTKTIIFEASNDCIDLITTASVFSDPLLPKGPYRVGYKYDPATRSVYYCQAPMLPGNAGKQPDWMIMAQSVTKFKLSFHDGRGWKDKWTFKHDNLLPRAVRIEIEIGSNDHGSFNLDTIVPICCTDRESIVP